MITKLVFLLTPDLFSSVYNVVYTHCLPKNDSRFGFIACAKVSIFLELAKVYLKIYNFLPFDCHTDAITAILLLPITRFLFRCFHDNGADNCPPLSLCSNGGAISRGISPAVPCRDPCRPMSPGRRNAGKPTGLVCPEPAFGKHRAKYLPDG